MFVNPSSPACLLQLKGGNLKSVCFADRGFIQPFRRDTHVLEQIVNRLQNAGRAGLKHDFCQSLGPEIPTLSDEKVLA